MCDTNKRTKKGMTLEGTPKAQLQKESHQTPNRRALQVHLRNGAVVGRRIGSTHKGLGLKFFFCNFLLLKTFPKKCVSSFMSG